MDKRGLRVDKQKQKKLTSKEIQIALIENFVNMQKVLTNLTLKFDALTENITKLLQIFEISAKNFIQKTEEGDFLKGSSSDRDLLKKIDSLLDQNKTIAKGLTLIEEKIRHKSASAHIEDSSVSSEKNSRLRPLPHL
jgi:hypothetical protein